MSVFSGAAMLPDGTPRIPRNRREHKANKRDEAEARNAATIPERRAAHRPHSYPKAA